MRASIAALVLLTACEHVDDLADAPALVAPAAPELDAVRFASSEREPAPPKPAAAPVAPDLINLPGRVRQWFTSLDREQRSAVRVICRERRANPCAGMMPRPQRDGDGPDALALAYERLGTNVFDDRVTRLCRHRGAGVCDTPLVVAFDGEPITFTPANGIAFAFGAEPTVTDWPAATTPWIALDRDGDGAITSGAELFGNATRLPDGTTANHGYEALAALDDNRDGAIDWRDRAFTRLVLWADADGDRTSAPGELTSLASTIVSIPLAHEIDARCTNGNCEGQRGAMTFRDASGAHRTGAVVDVYLVGR